MNRIRAEVTIRGRVQGVWFRQSTCNMAREYELTGWCCNNADGTVTAVFEGPAMAVEVALEWCKKGPELAKVDNINIKRTAPTGEFSSFNIA